MGIEKGHAVTVIHRLEVSANNLLANPSSFGEPVNGQAYISTAIVRIVKKKKKAWKLCRRRSRSRRCETHA